LHHRLGLRETESRLAETRRLSNTLELAHSVLPITHHGAGHRRNFVLQFRGLLVGCVYSSMRNCTTGSTWSDCINIGMCPTSGTFRHRALGF
jgi:hypothetical protein